jgi:hypothetical protein
MGNIDFFITKPEMIGNTRFRVVKHAGTGNQTTKNLGVKNREMVRLQNWVIDYSVVQDFLQLLYDMGEEPIKVKLSNRRTSSRWGTAWGRERRTVIYRHTAWTFLHELAHILVWNKDNLFKQPKAHGREFGKYLKMLYETWMEHIEPRWDAVKKAALVAPTPPRKKPTPRSYDDILPSPVRERKRHVVQGAELFVGDRVWFNGTRGRRVEGIVKRVNRKSCRVTDCKIDGEPCADWRVSPRLLHKFL